MRKIIVIIALMLFTVGVSAQKAYRDSLLHVDSLLQLHPDSLNLHLEKAAYNLLLHQWSYAKNEYDIILDILPDNISALYYRAYANERLARYNFARQDYEHLLRLVPNNYQTLLGLALLNDKDNRTTEAMDQINHVIELFPDKAEAYAARAGMESSRGEYLLAAYDLTDAIRRDPKNTDYILQRADAFIRAGKKDQALNDLEMLVKMGLNRQSLSEFFKRADDLK